MTQERASSEIVGRADFAGKNSAVVVVYRALRLIRCAECDQVIAEGELFTRHTLAGQGLRILPKCQKCAPLILRSEGEETAHPMLDAILSPSAERSQVLEHNPDKQLTSENTPLHGKRESVRDAMLQRLGPALRGTRRNRR